MGDETNEDERMKGEKKRFGVIKKEKHFQFKVIDIWLVIHGRKS